MNMNLDGVKIGFAITGSFCSIELVLPQIKALVNSGAKVIPILSETVANTDSRTGAAADLIAMVSQVCGCDAITTIVGAEPIGPKKLLDIVVIAPCTGNTMAKIANGVTDTSVTMAAKANMRNQNPLVIAVSTNDGLSASAKNMAALLNTKNVYFVPFMQDDPINKPTSIMSNMSLILPTVAAALDGKQKQPILFRA